METTRINETNEWLKEEGINLDTNTGLIENDYFPLRRAFHTNKVLIEYLNELDFYDIVSRKIESFGGYVKISQEKIDYYFSNKEKEIIKENIIKVKSK